MVPFLKQNDFGSAGGSRRMATGKYIADDKGVTLSGQPPARRAPNTSQRQGSPISPFAF